MEVTSERPCRGSCARIARTSAGSDTLQADPALARAERWARERLAEGTSVAGMAEAAGLTVRTLARRVTRATGCSPVRLLQRLRVERALELLGTTTLSVEAIARQVGYVEATTLRRLLRREVGGSPRELRRNRA